MITCKEDLVGFYVLRSDKEVFELFVDKCEEFGLIWNAYNGKAASFNYRADVRIGGAPEDFYIDRNLKKLTLSDFKPTRTEYVNIKCSIFDLKDLKAEFEAGELYMPDGNYGFCGIPSCDEEVFVMKFNDKCVYRKVEREVTWQGELMAAIRGGSPIGEGSVRVGGSDLTDEQFIEMCHKVYHLTK